MDSSGAPDEMRRRSEEELGGGEALDNLHGSAAKRTLPQRVNGQRGRGYCPTCSESATAGLWCGTTSWYMRL